MVASYELVGPGRHPMTWIFRRADMETIKSRQGETLWAVMIRIENTKSLERYHQWQAANPHIGEAPMAKDEVVNVPEKD